MKANRATLLANAENNSNLIVREASITKGKKCDIVQTWGGGSSPVPVLTCFNLGDSLVLIVKLFGLKMIICVPPLLILTEREPDNHLGWSRLGRSVQVAGVAADIQLVTTI